MVGPSSPSRPNFSNKKWWPWLKIWGRLSQDPIRQWVAILSSSRVARKGKCCLRSLWRWWCWPRTRRPLMKWQATSRLPSSGPRTISARRISCTRFKTNLSTPCSAYTFYFWDRSSYFSRKGVLWVIWEANHNRALISTQQKWLNFSISVPSMEMRGATVKSASACAGTVRVQNWTRRRRGMLWSRWMLWGRE